MPIKDEGKLIQKSLESALREPFEALSIALTTTGFEKDPALALEAITELSELTKTVNSLDSPSASVIKKVMKDYDRIVSKYSDFWTEKQTNNFRECWVSATAMFRLTETLESLSKILSTKENTIPFLNGVYELLEALEELIEDNLAIYSYRLLSVLLIVFSRLPAQIYSLTAYDEEDARKKKRLLRRIKRVVDASPSVIRQELQRRDALANTLSEEDFLEYNISRNWHAIDFLGSLIREDSSRKLTDEERRGNDLLEQVIDDHRHTQLFGERG